MKTKIVFCSLSFLLSLCAFSQPVFNKVQIEGSDLEQVANVDSYSGWISFAENNDVNIESYFTDYNQILGLGAHDKMELQKVKKDDLEGYEHYFYRQNYKGIEVELSGYSMHTKDGVLYGADGKIVSGIDFDLDKVLSEVVAKETAINAVNANIFAWEIIEVESQLKSDLKDPNATNYPTGKLVITQVEPDKWTNENYRLAYKFDIICIEPDQHIIVYVDAISGIVIKNFDAGDYDSCVSGTTSTKYEGSSYALYTMHRGFPYDDYILETECIGDGTTQTGRYTVKEHNGGHPWWDATALILNNENDWAGTLSAPASCLWGIEQAYNYFKSTHGRNGTSNSSSKNMRIWYEVDGISSSNYTNSTNDYDLIKIKTGEEHSNVLSHEFTHGVFQNETGGLTNAGTEADGIEESFCDIFSVMTEKYTFPSSWNWSTGNKLEFGIERFLNAPHTSFRYGVLSPQAAFYEENGFWNINDPYSVAGVCSYWFYRLSVGGLTTVSGIGENTARLILYRALTNYVTTSETYPNLRAHTKQAAIDLYGACSNEHAQVCAAWDAVQVLGTAYSFCVTLNGSPTLCDDGTDFPAVYTAKTRAGTTFAWSIPSTWIPNSSPTTSSTYTLTGTANTTTKTISVTAYYQGNSTSTYKTVSFYQCGPGCSPCKVAQIDSLDTYSIYPNPATSTLNIHFQSSMLNSQGCIFNNQGIIVKEFNLNDSYSEINVSQLSPGFYFLRLVSPTHSILEPIQIIR